MVITIVPEKLFKTRSLRRLGRELNAFARANSDAPGMQRRESSLLTHLVIGSGIAIAHTLPEWGKLSGGATVYFIAIAAVTLEITGDWLERASSLARRSSRCERPIPPKSDPACRLSGEHSRCLRTVGAAPAAAGSPNRVAAVAASARSQAVTRKQAPGCNACSHAAETRNTGTQAAGD
jgi:hypothetical protein